MDVERIAAIAVDCGLNIHRRIGPGLLESAYEIVLAHALERRGLAVARQQLISIRIDDLVIDAGFRADLIVEGVLLIKLKSIDRLAPVHGKQVLTYLRFLELPVGLLMNFGGETFKEGLRRIVNNHISKTPRAKPPL
uniref:GxxExxY protein n=1 Tax=uncultured Sphingomonas sp. TaxID=158754 RepID=UPI0035CC10FB